MLFPRGGGGGGHFSLGPVHHPRQSLSEKHPKRGWSDGTHSSLNTTPRVRTGLSLPDFLYTLSADCPRNLWIWYLFFLHIFLFSIPLTRYARYEPGGEKDTLFTRFYWRGCCTGPNETCPPPRGVIPNNCRKVWWCFLVISCTFWRSRKKLSNSPKLSCGFNNNKIKRKRNWKRYQQFLRFRQTENIESRNGIEKRVKCPYRRVYFFKVYPYPKYFWHVKETLLEVYCTVIQSKRFVK